MDPVQITAVQDVLITVSPIDALGGPAHVEPGSLKATSSDPAVLSDGMLQSPDTPDATSYAILCVNNGQAGASATITLTADADLGTGVETITAEVPIAVVEPKAVAFQIVSVQGVPKKP